MWFWNLDDNNKRSHNYINKHPLRIRGTKVRLYIYIYRIRHIYIYIYVFTHTHILCDWSIGVFTDFYYLLNWIELERLRNLAFMQDTIRLYGWCKLENYVHKAYSPLYTSWQPSLACFYLWSFDSMLWLVDVCSTRW